MSPPPSPDGRDRLASAAFNLWFYPFALFSALAAWVAALLGGRGPTRAVIAWWTRRVRGAVRLLLRGRIEVLGRENLPASGPFVIVSKHQSELDAIVMFSLFPHMGAVVMAELADYPFVGRLMRALGYPSVSVDRGPQGRTAAVVAAASEIISENRPVLIYPEGTLMSLGARERYRSGAWRIYAATGVPAIPVAQSLGAIWPRREWTKRVGRSGALEFLEPMAPGLDQETFMADVEARIEARTMALIRAHAAPADRAAAEDRHARGVANED